MFVFVPVPVPVRVLVHVPVPVPVSVRVLVLVPEALPFTWPQYKNQTWTYSKALPNSPSELPSGPNYFV